MEGVEGEDRAKLQQALDLSLGMNPLTPDHHFYIDQGANARVRLVALAIGRKLVEAGALEDPEDAIFLHYNELRLLMADQSAFDAKELVSDRRDEQEDAYELRPRVAGSAPPPTRRSPSRTTRSGASRTSSTRASRRRPARSRASRRRPASSRARRAT